MTNMKRVLGIDYGEKNIGLAISDPFGITAQGLEIISNRSIESVFESIQSHMQHHGIGDFVIGLPLNMNGSEGPAAKRVKEFGSKLHEHFNLPVHYIDERLTSVQIEKTLIHANVRRKKRRKIKDRLEAVLILQNYLDKISP